jgi:hypothetical protein
MSERRFVIVTGAAGTAASYMTGAILDVNGGLF